MSKFNLKKYVKVNGDEHIDQKLGDSHEEAPEVIMEKQLEKGRTKKPEVILEGLLAEIRKGGAEQSPEYRLNNEKSKIVEYRNPSAYEGDMNKLEEQRLKGDPVEDEKYEMASETPKDMRWWEEKSPDGLKLTHKNRKNWLQKSADVVDEYESKDKKEDWDMSPALKKLLEQEEPESGIGTYQAPEPKPKVEIEDESEIDVKTDQAPDWWGEEGEDLVEDNDDGFTGTDELISKKTPKMTVVKEKYLDDQLPGIYMLLTYNKDAFGDNVDAAKEFAMKKVIEGEPQLAGKIDISDFYQTEEGSLGEGQIAFRVLGDEYLPIIMSHVEGPEEDSGEGLFTEDDYFEDAGSGTPTAWGSVKSTVPITEDNQDEILEDAIAFINKTHPDIIVDRGSLDLSAIDQWFVAYMAPIIESGDTGLDEVSVPYEEMRVQQDEPGREAGTDFDIVVANKKKE